MQRDLVEIFGYSPSDTSLAARSLWNLGACPFTNRQCTKYNHDQTIIYGTCSVTSSFGDTIICPNRLYADNYRSIRKVSDDTFGNNIPFYFYDEYIKNRLKNHECVVALGNNSGKEIKIGKILSMDWIIARIKNAHLEEYVGIEVQSIDITGNYRDAWYGYKNLTGGNQTKPIPASEHGLNWANVHKRLIPQIIRKGVVYSKSKLTPYGLYFIVPDIVYNKFDEIIGTIPLLPIPQSDSITVVTYGLGPVVSNGNIRDLLEMKKIRFLHKDFTDRFISGPNLPDGIVLDNAVRNALGVS